jgi:hypothetical protein
MGVRKRPESAYIEGSTSHGWSYVYVYVKPDKLAVRGQIAAILRQSGLFAIVETT